MSAPPRLRSLSMETTPDAPGWWERVLAVLSPFIQDVSGALSKGLTRRENMRSNYNDKVRFTTKATLADTWPILVKNDLGMRAYACWLVDLVRIDGADIDYAPAMTWKHDDKGQFALTFHGLEASTEYRATIIYE